MSTPNEPARDAKPPVLTRAQEVMHVQARLSEGAPGTAPAPPPLASAKPAAPAPLQAATGGGAARVAAALWLASSLLALAAVALFVLPEARRRLSPEAELITYSPSSTPPPPSAPGSVASEEASPFQGFVLMVDSVPPSAHVTINGEDQGQAPVSTGLDCAPGTPVRIELSLRGFERAQHVTLCREDTLVKVSARLKRSRPAGAPGKDQ